MTKLHLQDMWHGDKKGCDGILLQTFVIHSGHRPRLLGLRLLALSVVDLSLLLQIEKNDNSALWGSETRIAAALIFKPSIDRVR